MYGTSSLTEKVSWGVAVEAEPEIKAVVLYPKMEETVVVL